MGLVTWTLLDKLVHRRPANPVRTLEGNLTLLRNRKFLIAGLLLLGVAVASIAMFVFKAPDEQSPIPRIGYLNITASLPLFVAEEKGFFDDEGITIKSLQTASSNQLVDGIVAGNLDAFVEASAVPVLAVELQSPGRLKVFSVSSITKEAPFDALLVKEDSPLKNLSDLAGKKIGMFPGTTATNLLKQFLADEGVDISATTFIPIPPQNHLAALLEGSVDVVHAYEPTIAIAISRGGIRRLYPSVYAEMLDHNPQGVAVVSTEFVNTQPDTAKKVIHALERAMVFMRENEAESREIMARRMNLDKAVADQSVFLYMLPHDEIDPSILQEYADMLVQLGELAERLDVNDILYRE